MPTRVPHCVYNAIHLTLQQYYEIEMPVPFIFLLTGGFTFRLKRVSNDNVALHQVLGNTYHYNDFVKHTGLRVQRVTEQEPDKALDSIRKDLQDKGYQVVYTNCFFLPYDRENYKKSSENHLVLIHSYDEENQEFCVSDAMYRRVQIEKEALFQACVRSYPSLNLYKHLEFNKERDVSAQEVAAAAKAVLRKQAESCLKNPTWQAFKGVLEEMDQQERIFRKMSCESMARELRHPNSMVFTRQLLSEACEFLFPPLMQPYEELSEMWNSFSSNLMRFSQKTVDLETMLHKYEQILEREMALAQQIVHEIAGVATSPSALERR